ncbi:MAG: beta-lactamase class [Acidobacteriota bacterium]|nr:beta-lactamase class [Acidobacteriota bacterium]
MRLTIRRMTPKLRALALLAALFLASCASAPLTLDQRLDRILAQHPAQTIAISYQDLRSGVAVHRNENTVFHAASTMKVPVMLGIFDAVSRGELRLEQPVRLRNEFASILDGSTYSLEAREDSDPALYDLVGQEIALQELVRRMIVRSSNLATNNVIELIGAKRVMALMHEIGANDIQVLRGVEDDKAYHAGMNNTTTSHDLLRIFCTLGEGKALSPEASKAMTGILLAQEFNDGIPAGLPKGIPVAHKTGSITAIAHDAALVFDPSGTYGLVILTRGFAKSEDAEKVMAEISRAVWEARRSL